MIVHWTTTGLAESKRLWVEDCLAELSGLLAHTPTSLRVDFQALGEHEASRVLLQFQVPFANESEEFAAIFQIAEVSSALLVCSDREMPFVQSHLKAHRKALWGANRGGLSFAWQLEHKQLVWREVLHILGAVDCYDLQRAPDGRPLCELGNCLMQYAPTEETVGDWPFICRQSLQLIRQASGLTTVAATDRVDSNSR